MLIKSKMKRKGFKLRMRRSSFKRLRLRERSDWSRQPKSRVNSLRMNKGKPTREIRGKSWEI
jgi:hypothetical protein